MHATVNGEKYVNYLLWPFFYFFFVFTFKKPRIV